LFAARCSQVDMLENNSMRIILAVLAVVLFSLESSQAAMSKRDQVLSKRETNCKAQARNQYPGVRFIKRREYVNRCMGRFILNKDAFPRKPNPVHERLMDRSKSDQRVLANGR
jgi:hypothetical protein